VHAQSGFLTESYNNPTPTSCPAVISVQNGGFDSGLAPWETPSAAIGNPTFSVISPGYNGGAHALQLEFPAANVTSWNFLQDIGRQCKGSQYFTSFAVNWLKFSTGNEFNECPNEFNECPNEFNECSNEFDKCPDEFDKCPDEFDKCSSHKRNQSGVPSS
jgi:hypothetical protein